MFHATVASVNEYFHVKVFNINLKEKFTKENVIMISNYLEFKGILEINEDSTVLEAGPVQSIRVPISLIRKSKETPKIFDIRKYATGTPVYGLFTLHKVMSEILFMSSSPPTPELKYKNFSVRV